MKRIKKRLRKKIHRKYIEYICYKASLSPEWREKLFQAKAGEVFGFSKSDLAKLLGNEPFLRKYQLQFCVKVVPNFIVPSWMLQDDTYIAFEFFAKEFPSIHAFSANNPAIR